MANLHGHIPKVGKLIGRISDSGKIIGRISDSGKITGHVSIGTIIRDDTKTYILVDSDGNEIPAVLVDEEVTLTATANDIRLGTIAVTNDGVTEGSKVIPAYHTTEGTKMFLPGKSLEIKLDGDKCQYTKLMVLICDFNTSISNSVSVQMTVIGDSVYSVKSTEALSTVTVDNHNRSIDLGLANSSSRPYILRYMTYKEEE